LKGSDNNIRQVVALADQGNARESGKSECAHSL
jgi:hypothetical protein